MRKTLTILLALIPFTLFSQSEFRYGAKIGDSGTRIDSLKYDVDSIYFYYNGTVSSRAWDSYYTAAASDEDARAFLSVTINEQPYISAVDYLVTALKDSGLWNKTDIYYPFIGGDSTKHRYNLKSPYDADTSYRINWLTDGIHNGDGANAVGNTYYNVGDRFNNLHAMILSDTDESATLEYDMGADSADNSHFILSANNYRYDLGSGKEFLGYSRLSQTINSMPIKNSKGVFSISVTDTSNSQYIDGIKVSMGVREALPSSFNYFNVYIGGSNSRFGIQGTSGRTYQAASFGDYLSDKEMNDLATISRVFNAMITRLDTVSGRHFTYDVAEYPITITEAPYDFKPDTTDKNNYALWSSFDVGAMIAFQQRSWFNDFTGYADASYFGYEMPDTIDVSTWISKCDSFGVDYMSLTVMESTGFSWALMPDFPERLVNKYNSFTNYDYRNNPFADSNLVRNFVDTCRAYGIEPILYINPIRNLLFTPQTEFTHEIFDSLDVVHYNNWFQKFTQNLVSEYELNFIWIDGWRYGPWNETNDGFDELLADGTVMKSVDFQGLYNAVKAVDSTCLVIMNDFADTTFARFPYDIASSEELVIDLVGISDVDLVRDSSLTYNGIKYHMPYEFICNNAENGFWYATNNEGVAAVRPLSEMQSVYDRAKAVGAKFHMAIIPGRNGIVQEEQWEIWRNLVW